jgi:GT2 family glycosyltransferase
MNFIKSIEDTKNIEETKETFGNYEVTNVIGACLFIKREVVDKIGLLDEKFNPAYGEETDFCLRAKKRGFKLFYIGKVKIVHIGGSSTKHVKDWIWQIKKRNAIRLEWLNLNLFQIVKYTFIHIGSALLSEKPFSKIKMLIKAYRENIKNIKEIKDKRRERNSWEK